MSNDSREKMVRSAASLTAARGINATSFSDVVTDSGAPRGSIYHYFPRGKEQLTEDAIRYTSDRVLAYLGSGPTDSPRAAMEHFVNLWRLVVEQSGGAAGCAVAGVAVDTANDDPVMALVRDTFRSWMELLAARLELAGIARERATPISQIAVTAMEGALIICRSERSSAAIDVVAGELYRLLPD